MAETLTNFPNGASSFGLPVINSLAAYYGIVGKIKFLCNRSTGRAVTTGTGGFSTPYSTLAAALADGELRAGSGDAIFVLPGHSESVAAAATISSLAGIAIVGIGRGSTMPTFRWTNTAGAWTVSAADILFHGLRLRMEGANGITKALAITGADFTMRNCDVEVASGATAKSAIAVEIGSGALRCTLDGNRFRGTETHNVTDGIKVVGGTTPDDLRIVNNQMIFSATATNGLVHITVAAKRLFMANNVMYNTHTASTTTIAVDAVAADGFIYSSAHGTIADNTASAQGVVFADATSTIKLAQNFDTDEKQKNAILNPVAAT